MGTNRRDIDALDGETKNIPEPSDEASEVGPAIIDAQEAVNRQVAKDYLRRAGIDTSIVAPEMLLTLYESFKDLPKPGPDDTEKLAKSPDDLHLIYDEDLGVYCTEEGDIVGYKASDTTVSVEEILSQAGQRLTYLLAKQSSVEAERATWLKKVSDQYDAKYNKLVRSVAWLKKAYTPLAESHINEMNKKRKKDGKEALTSLKIGLLEIKLVAGKESVVVEDELLAVQSLRAMYKDSEGPFYDPEYAALEAEYEALLFKWRGRSDVELWINTKESVAKNAIPAEVKEALDVPGLYWKPGGDRTCEIK